MFLYVYGIVLAGAVCQSLGYVTEPCDTYSESQETQSLSGLQIRLTGSDKPNIGYVEVFQNGVWGAICNSALDNDISSTVCKQLGYNDGELWIQGFAGYTGDTVMKTLITCENDESQLDDCGPISFRQEPYNGKNTCVPFQPSVIYCYGPVRFHRKYNSSIGKVMINIEGQHKTVCRQGFDQDAVNVVCRELGFYNRGTLLPSATYASSDDQSSLAQYSFRCQGIENSLTDCYRVYQACNTDEVAVVACNEDNGIQSTGSDGDVKILDSGEVQTLYNGVWGTICGPGWSDNDAQVACRELGYQQGKAYEKYIGDDKPVWISEIECTGDEFSLKSCSKTLYEGNSVCSQPYTKRAMAYCYDSLDIEFSLVGGDGNYGYVQMRKDGKSGYVCDFYFLYNAEANAVCKSIGFESGELFTTMPTPLSSATFWGNDIYCTEEFPLLQLCNSGDESWSYLTSGDEQYNQCRESGHFMAVSCQ